MKYSTTIYSPDGKQTIDCHPSKLEQMLSSGWTTERKTNKVKPASDDNQSENKSTD